MTVLFFHLIGAFSFKCFTAMEDVLKRSSCRVLLLRSLDIYSRLETKKQQQPTEEQRNMGEFIEKIVLNYTI